MTQFAYDKYPMSMRLSKEAINDFKAIYLKEYGVELSDAEAYTKGSNLLRLMHTVLSTCAKEAEKNRL